MNMKKYYIGFAVLVLITLGLTGFTLYQGVSGKQDRQTEQKAQDIATKLNEYVRSRQAIPESLDAAGIKDVPATITYTKKSETTYEFCVTYKHASEDYGGVGFEQIVSGAVQQELIRSSDADSSYTPSSLYLPYTHKAGKSCQTVEPYYLYDNFLQDTGNSPDLPMLENYHINSGTLDLGDGNVPTEQN
jgi:Tfp pilus assembly protein PilV